MQPLRMLEVRPVWVRGSMVTQAKPRTKLRSGKVYRFAGHPFPMRVHSIRGTTAQVHILDGVARPSPVPIPLRLLALAEEELP